MASSEQYRQQAAARNHVAMRQPPRRESSVRRTSSMQSLWSQDASVPMTMVARARDIMTFDAHRAPRVLGEDAFEAKLGSDDRLVSMTGSRQNEVLERFAGMAPGGQLRAAVAQELPGEIAQETPLFRVLDDFAGAVFMSKAAWYTWPGGLENYHQRTRNARIMDRKVENVCLSYVSGSIAMTEDGRGIDANSDHPVGPLPVDTGDPDGFHAMAEFDGPNQWRLRRTDLWREGEHLVADAWFQDSSAIHGKTDQRNIFHEYGLVARFDAISLDLRAITVTPYVLPFTTCHAAPDTAQVLVGQNARALRSHVLAVLRGPAGCTHLNDMLRSLQDVAGLADRLTAAGGQAS